ncbi:hypothetical protein GCM10010525_30300 [Glutamicibacter bergerei]|uniref:Uncharacterized protein n=1 Tax=Glutamicibacter ardleyensis TaxID=225894 RepID=A0ABQ2DK64_9MICC|nr:hypothetical protein GCM10007173_19840 [Glutamicibacter ardleyensis]
MNGKKSSRQHLGICYFSGSSCLNTAQLGQVDPSKTPIPSAKFPELHVDYHERRNILELRGMLGPESMHLWERAIT